MDSLLGNGSAGDGGSPITSYTVQWKKAAGSWDTDEDVSEATATDTTHTITSLELDVEYAVRVIATNAIGDGPASDEITATPVALTSQQRAGTQNNPATGGPAVSGTAQVGETLTADTSGIADEDGLTSSVFDYQWVRNDGSTDTEIQSATDSTYTLVSDDEGKSIKVRVSFTDDAGNDESLTSTSTATVAATVPRAPRSVDLQPSGTGRLEVTWQAPESNGGSEVTGYKVQWKLASGSWETSADVSETTSTGTTHTIASLELDVEYAVRVFATNVVGDGPASDEVTATAVPLTSQQQAATQNTPATGQPTISGTAQVGETLTTDTSGISDADGLDNAVFGYEWITNDGTTDTDIQDAIGSTYGLGLRRRG